MSTVIVVIWISCRLLRVPLFFACANESNERSEFYVWIAAALEDVQTHVQTHRPSLLWRHGISFALQLVIQGWGLNTSVIVTSRKLSPRPPILWHHENTIEASPSQSILWHHENTIEASPRPPILWHHENTIEASPRPPILWHHENTLLPGRYCDITKTLLLPIIAAVDIVTSRKHSCCASQSNLTLWHHENTQCITPCRL